MLPILRPLRFVRLDAADVVRRALHQRRHQLVRLLLDLGPRRNGTLLGRPVHLLGEEAADERRAGGLHQLHEVRVEDILVPLAEAVHVVVDDAGVVVDGEALSDVLVVLVAAAVVAKLGLQVRVGALFDAVQGRADVVHDGHDAGRGALLLDQLAHDRVVEVLDRGPLDALLDVLFLQSAEKKRKLTNVSGYNTQN